MIIEVLKTLFPDYCHSVIMLSDVSPHPPGPDVVSAGHLDNPLLVLLVTRLPDDDDLTALLLLFFLLVLLVPLVLLVVLLVPGSPGHLPGVVDHTARHQVLSLPLPGPVIRVVILQKLGTCHHP